MGRVVGLYQRKFMANRNKKSAPLSTPTDPASVSSDSTDHDMYREEFDVDFSSAERQSGRGTNRARDPDYIDPSLLGQELNSDADGPLNDWLWSLVKTMRAGNDNDKLYPPGVVRVIESYTVFISGDSSKTGGHAKYSRKEGRRIVLRAVDNVEQRFGEPVFGRTSELVPFCLTLLAVAEVSSSLHSGIRSFTSSIRDLSRSFILSSLWYNGLSIANRLQSLFASIRCHIIVYPHYCLLPLLLSIGFNRFISFTLISHLLLHPVSWPPFLFTVLDATFDEPSTLSPSAGRQLDQTLSLFLCSP